MEGQLIPFIESLKADRRIASFGEEATKQAVVLRILSLLGWNTYNIDEVTPEYSVAGKRVDYSLRIGNANKVFVEVKKIGEDLEKENHQEQLLNYAFQEGVRLCILTNGITWCFYLPLHEGSWEQRKFYTIDIFQQKSEDVVSKFFAFLSKDNVGSGDAVQNADAIYKGQQKLNILKETLPKAWNKIIEEADDSLIELINDTTEKLCGFKADNELIEQFLSRHKVQFTSSSTIHPTRVTSSTPAQTIHQDHIPDSVDYAGKSISAFYFKGTKHSARSWKELLMKLCELLNVDHAGAFDKVLSLRGRKRPYFTNNANELRVPQKINNTNIFIETNQSANSIVKVCFDMMAIFGYQNNDLRIESS